MRAYVGLLAFALLTGTASAHELAAFVANVEGEGARFSVQGKVNDLPNGVVLHVTLQVRAAKPGVNDVAFFQVRLVDGAFSVRKTWPLRTFPPLVYHVRLDLLVSEQSPALRRHLRREFGYRFDQRMLLAQRDVEVGDAEQREAFDLAALEGLQSFVTRVRTLQVEVSQALSTPARGEAQQEIPAELVARLKGFRKELRRHLTAYMAWKDEPVIATIKSTHNELTRALIDHARGHARVLQDVLRVAHRLELLHADLDSRLRAKRKARPAVPTVEKEGK